MSQTKPRVGIFGLTNSGKSTLFNFLLERQASIVSPIQGTTTDPVRASIELLGYGPVVLIDTAGIDDRSQLGDKRVKQTYSVLSEVELAIVVLSACEPGADESEFIEQLKIRGKKYITVQKPFDQTILDRIKTALGKRQDTDFFGGRVSRGDTVILVCPIDSEAPTGKLIMPQVGAIRSTLDLHARAIVVQVEELAQTILNEKPRLVVTDSQAFDRVRKIVPNDVELTSFSILLSEQKGDPLIYGKGLEQVDKLAEADRILIIEHCTHQSSCDDIARVKIPHLLEKKTGVKLQFMIVSGRDPLPSDLDKFALVLQCGGCVASREATQDRIAQCTESGVAITNYGMLLKSLLC